MPFVEALRRKGVEMAVIERGLKEKFEWIPNGEAIIFRVGKGHNGFVRKERCNYLVFVDDNGAFYCACPDHSTRERVCKHIVALLMHMKAKDEFIEKLRVK